VAALALVIACGPGSGTGAPAATQAPVAASSTPAPTANTFYQGKTIKIVVGFAPGAAWDQYSRLVAKHLGKHLAGSPAVIVENRPGAGTKLAATAIVKTEPQDGTVVANLAEGISQEQLAGLPGVEFDVLKMQWIGSAQVNPTVCIVRADLGITDIRDIMPGGKFADREIFMAATAVGSTTDYVPRSLNIVAGTKFKLVQGYAGVAPMDLAFQKKEVDGYCAGAAHFVDQNAQLLAGTNPFGRIIVITGPVGFDKLSLIDPRGLVPSLRNVPTDHSLAKDKEALEFLQLLYVPQFVKIPWALGPDVPKDRVELLRAAWAKTFADPEFLADAKTQNLVPVFTPGAKVQDYMKTIMSADAKFVAQLKVLMR
jgi:tripartite-type tricarboxylate transporter receptor subunit TctC